MQHVYRLLREHTPFFRPVCDLLERHVYEPMRQGERLQIQAIATNASGSLQGKLEAAISGPGGDRGVEMTNDVPVNSE